MYIMLWTAGFPFKFMPWKKLDSKVEG